MPLRRPLEVMKVESRRCGLVAQYRGKYERVVATKFETPILRKAIKAGRKIYLERRSGESTFAPRQYFYAASKSGVVPEIDRTAQLLNAVRHGGAAFEKRNNGLHLFTPASEGRGSIDRRRAG